MGAAILRKPALRRSMNAAFYVAGIWLFAVLVQQSGVSWDLFTQVGWSPLVWLLAVYSGLTILDVYAWYLAAEGNHRFDSLLLLRVGGESLTNALPGGVMLGESYKAAKLKQWDETPISVTTPRLLLIKFGLGYSQSLFVLVGLLLSFSLLKERSAAIVGFAGLHVVCLTSVVAMCLLMAVPMGILLSGRSFTGMAKLLSKPQRPRLSAWLARHQDALQRLDAGFAHTLGSGRRAALAMFGVMCVRWFAAATETYMLLWFLGLQPTWQDALVIESLGSMFRLIFFMVPAGVGGQDASFFGLFKLYGFPTAEAAVFVILKRAREVAWIGLGFLMIALERRKGRLPQR